MSDSAQTLEGLGTIHPNAALEEIREGRFRRALRAIPGIAKETAKTIGYGVLVAAIGGAGAIVGAGIGSIFGPVGAVAGATIGASLSLGYAFRAYRKEKNYKAVRSYGEGYGDGYEDSRDKKGYDSFRRRPKEPLW